MIQRLCSLATLAFVCAAGANCDAALLNSWENSVEGWGILQAPYMTSGFSTTTGVTNQSYSWVVVGTAAPDYSAMFGGPSTLALTSLLATTDKISIDVTCPIGGEFGFYQQWTAVVNNSDLGYTSLDGYSYSQSANIGSSTPKTLTWSLTAAQRAVLATSPNPTSIVFQVGGGGGGTMYLDNLRTVSVPEAGSVVLAGFAALIGVAGRRRRLG